MIVYAIGLHLMWALLLNIDGSAANVTSIASTRYLLPKPLTSIAMIVVAFAALYGAIWEANRNRAWKWMIPQQILLMVGAMGAVEAVWDGQFADGVVRSRSFIAADQWDMVWATILHTLAMASIAREGWSGRY
jgi:4-amino-4-deoxy-L-arabinose transferase-like glycosyltransferase